MREVDRLLEEWAPLHPEQALELLLPTFFSIAVRAAAVRWIFQWTDDNILVVLPQLVQSLKFEVYHDSALARALLQCAMSNPRIVQSLFWCLKTDLSSTE